MKSDSDMMEEEENEGEGAEASASQCYPVLQESTTHDATGYRVLLCYISLFLMCMCVFNHIWLKLYITADYFCCDMYCGQYNPAPELLFGRVA